MVKIEEEWKKLSRNGNNCGGMEIIVEEWKKLRRNGNNCRGMEKIEVE